MMKENDDDLDRDRNHVETTTQIRKILGAPMIDHGIMIAGVKPYMSLPCCDLYCTIWLAFCNYICMKPLMLYEMSFKLI